MNRWEKFNLLMFIVSCDLLMLSFVHGAWQMVLWNTFVVLGNGFCFVMSGDKRRPQ